MEKVFAFAGQGSQFYGMGEGLYRQNIYFRKHMDEGSRFIMKNTQIPVWSIMSKSENRMEKFYSILESSLAIYLFERSAALMMLDEGIQPDLLVGSSLGELVCLATAGIINDSEAVEIIIHMCENLEKYAEAGSMVAVFHGSDILKQCSDIFVNWEVSAINHPQHFVVAGKEKFLSELIQNLRKRDINYQILPIAFAFHSSGIDVIKDIFQSCIPNIAGRKAKYPIYSCSTGRIMYKWSKEELWGIIRNPMDFVGFTKHVKKRQVLVDLSADGEMAALLKYMCPDKDEVYKISNIFNIDVDVTEIINTIKRSEEDNMKAYVFPGQGSQFKGMGAGLFDQFPHLVKQADDILGYSIKDLCLNDPDGLLGQTQYTQPALYITSALEYLKKIAEEGEEPHYLAGHSIGEYSAVFASGAMDFETGVRLVNKRGQLMAKAMHGAMAAVVGMSEQEVRTVLQNNQIYTIDIANLNTPSQIVISGMRHDIENAKTFFEGEENCRLYKVLDVSGAFHSRYMKEAMEEFAEYLKEFSFSPMGIPVLSNVTGRPYDDSHISKALCDQLVSSVQWTDSIRYLMGLGIEEITQVGPGRVVEGLVRSIKREAEPLVVNLEPEVQVQEVSSIEELGDAGFRDEYGVRLSYMIGGMNYGISGVDMVIKAGNAGILCIYGASGLSLDEVECSIQTIKDHLSNKVFGVNLRYSFGFEKIEKEIVDILLRESVTVVEASGYIGVTKSLVKYRVKGIYKDRSGLIQIPNRIISKLSRPEVARVFMSPPPDKWVAELLNDGEITELEAKLAVSIPMSNDICVEADSAGFTDGANALTRFPSIYTLRQRLVRSFQYSNKIRIGAAGGIGTPQSAAAAFMLGADFIVSGSLNQCTVEASTSDLVKNLLSEIDVQDTGYLPTRLEKIESTSKNQVLKKGSLFHVRGNKLHSLYNTYQSLSEIDESSLKQITKYFQKEIYEVIELLKEEGSYKESMTDKEKMAAVFNWYFRSSIEWALQGNAEHQLDFQVPCGPALGAYNQWVKGSKAERWEERHVDLIANKLMTDVASTISDFYNRVEE